MQPGEIRIGVLGAGQIGAGIAATLLRAGFATTMVEVNQGILAAGSMRARQLAIGRGKSRPRRPTTPKRPGSPRLFHHVHHARAAGQFTVVIEAVTENEAIKTGIFQALGGVLSTGAIVASNTSTIPISRMARSWIHPPRFAGMHFFHPAQRMELVEVIRGDQTADQTVTLLVDLARRLGKTPIVVRDCPRIPGHAGALPLPEPGTRSLAGRRFHGRNRRRRRAVWHADRPESPARLHRAGYRSGHLAARHGGRLSRPGADQPAARRDGALGRLGQKAAHGFRKHDRNQPRPIADPVIQPLLRQYQHKPQVADELAGQGEITDRLFLPMLLEAIRTVWTRGS